jgi:2-isopropylmalate synthase
MIESADGKGRRWSTIGVSPNIVDASYNALYDAITYKLFRDGAAPASGQGSGTVGSTARPA